MIATPDVTAIVHAWGQAMLRAAIQGGVALAIAWALCRAFHWRLPASIRCWVLRLAFAKVLLALVWWTPIPVPLLRPAPPNPVFATTETIEPVVELFDPSSSAPRSARSAEFNPTFALFGIWMAGFAGAAGLLAMGWLKTRRFRHACVPLADPAIIAPYRSLAHKLGVRRTPELLVSPAGGTPLLIGVLRPAVVVPQPILDSCSPKQLLLMLAHELAHHRRHDLWWAWLPATCRALLWFHPLVWIAGGEWSTAQESACDQIAIRATQATAGDYSLALLSAAALLRGRNRLLAVGTCTSRTQLERRILAMRHVQNWTWRRYAFAGITLAFPGVIALLPWRLVAAEAPRSDARAEQPRTSNGIPVLSEIPLLKEVFTKHATGASEKVSAGSADTKPAIETAPGYISTETFVLRASHDGILRHVAAKEGDDVAANQVLVEFASHAEAADVAAQEAQIEQDKVALERVKKLFSMHAVAPEEYDQRRLAVHIDEARLDALQVKLRQDRLASPMAGVVSRCTAHEGEFVKQGEPLLTVVSVTHPKVEFDLSASAYPKLKVGDGVEFKTSIYPAVFAGKIVFLSPSVDPESGTFRAKAVLDDPGQKLRAGMQGNVTVRLKQH